MNRKLIRLPDGRYIKQITPDLAYLFNQFGEKIAELTTENINERTQCPDIKQESDPAV